MNKIKATDKNKVLFLELVVKAQKNRLNKIKKIVEMIKSTTDEELTIARCNMILQLLEDK